MADMTILSLAMLGAVAFFAGIIDAISGGGGLLMLPTYLLIGVPPSFLTGTNLTSSIPGALVSGIRYAQSGKVHWSSSLISGATAMVGAVLGAKLNLLIPAEAIEWIVMALVPILAIVTLCKPNLGEDNNIHTLSKRKQIIISLLIGLILGTYNGFIAAGGGTFFLLAFAMALKLDLVTASGNTKICGLLGVLAAVATYGSSSAVLWKLSAFVAVFHMSGTYVGTGLALKRGAKVIRPMFILALVLLCIRMAFTLL